MSKWVRAKDRRIIMAKVHRVWETDIVEDHRIMEIIMDKEVLMVDQEEMEVVEALNWEDIIEVQR